MGLTGTHSQLLVPLLGLILISWLVQLTGLFVLHRSCTDRGQFDPWFIAVSGAGFPAADTCSKIYRYNWWAVWSEPPLALGIVASLGGWLGSGNNVLQRYRVSWIGLLAVATSLQMWSANVMLNLTDTFVKKQETSRESTRAHVAFLGFAALAGLNIILIFILGDDGPSSAESGYSGDEPLLGES